MQDYYQFALQALKYDQHLTEKEQRVLYYKLAKKYHPDLNPDVDPNIFKAIAAVYQDIRTGSIKNGGTTIRRKPDPRCMTLDQLIYSIDLLHRKVIELEQKVNFSLEKIKNLKVETDELIKEQDQLQAEAEAAKSKIPKKVHVVERLINWIIKTIKDPETSRRKAKITGIVFTAAGSLVLLFVPIASLVVSSVIHISNLSYWIYSAKKIKNQREYMNKLTLAMMKATEISLNEFQKSMYEGECKILHNTIAVQKSDLKSFQAEFDRRMGTDSSKTSQKEQEHSKQYTK